MTEKKKSCPFASDKTEGWLHCAEEGCMLYVKAYAECVIRLGLFAIAMNRRDKE